MFQRGSTLLPTGGPYRNFYLGPVKALDGDMSYTSQGITVLNVSSCTRVIFIVQHADNEPEPGTLRALRRSKILFKEEFDRGSGNFFADPLSETLMVVSREQDMNCTPRRLISPSGKLVSQLQGANIVIDRGAFPGDADVTILPSTDESFIQITNNTSYDHVVAGEQPAKSFPLRKQEAFKGSLLGKIYRPDKGPNVVFHIRVAKNSVASIMHPPDVFGVYALATVAQMQQGDPIEGSRATASFYSNVTPELPQLAELNIISYTDARRGDVATLCDGDPVTGPERFCVQRASRCQALDYDMVTNKS